jgi:hypothetical protein
MRRLRTGPTGVAAVLALLASGCTSDDASAPWGSHPSTDAAAETAADGTSKDVTGPLDSGTGTDQQSPQEDAQPELDADAAEAAPEDPCPALPIPSTCFGRSVVYREWSLTATGDGAYFADQAPWRLGFNRLHGDVWIVKFRVEDNTYFGRVSAGGNSTGGTAWIATDPCDPSFAIQSGLVTWSGMGGGMLDFVVARNDDDAQKLHLDPAYEAWSKTPQLKGQHCYYAVFENTSQPPSVPATVDWFTTVPDDCGSVNNTPDCYYLAIDMSHLLHDPSNGTVVQSAIIPGLSNP